MIVDALEILKIVMDNPVSRKVLRMEFKTCQGSHMKKIEHARPHHVSCHLHSWLVSAILMVHDKFSGIAGFEKTMRGIKNCAEEGSLT